MIGSFGLYLAFSPVTYSSRYGCIFWLSGADIAHPKNVIFNVTDVPEHWFDSGVDIVRTRSLSIAAHGEVIKFRQEGSIKGHPGVDRSRSPIPRAT